MEFSSCSILNDKINKILLLMNVSYILFFSIWSSFLQDFTFLVSFIRFYMYFILIYLNFSSFCNSTFQCFDYFRNLLICVYVHTWFGLFAYFLLVNFSYEYLRIGSIFFFWHSYNKMSNFSNSVNMFDFVLYWVLFHIWIFGNEKWVGIKFDMLTRINCHFLSKW